MKKLVIVGLVILFIIAVIYLVAPAKENKYLWAKQQLEEVQDPQSISENTKWIIKAFEELGDYKDSEELLTQAQLKLINNELEHGNPYLVIEYFCIYDMLSDYHDRDNLLQRARLMEVDRLLAENRQDEALEILQLCDFESPEVVERMALFNMAAVDQMLAENKYAEALKLLKQGNVESPEIAQKISDTTFAYAQQLEADGFYEEAYQEYINSKHASGLKMAYSVKYAHMLTKDKIAIGSNSTVFAVTKEGKVLYAGSGDNPVADWTDIVAIDYGDSGFLVGLKADGTVVARGANGQGQCDVSAWRDIVAISAGRLHTVGLKADGTVIAVGSNHSNQCDLSALSDVISIIAGSDTTYCIFSDGRPYNVSRSMSNWPDLAAFIEGGDQLAGIKLNGNAVLGKEAYTDYFYGERQEQGVIYGWGGAEFNESDIDHNHWSDIVCLDAGDSHCIAVRRDGSVFMGCNPISDSPSPDVAAWTNVAAVTSYNNYQVIGLLKDGSLITSGLNSETTQLISQWAGMIGEGKGLQ